MKTIAWKKIDPSDLKDSIWDKLDDTKIKLNLDAFEELFSKAQKVVKKKTAQKPKVANKAAPVKKKTAKATFISSDRTRLISIVLNRLHLDALEISDALEQYDSDTLTSDACDLLLPTLPTEREIKEVAQFTGDMMNDLATPDQYILVISGIIGYKERLNSMIFKESYKEDYDFNIENINKFFNAFELVKKNEDYLKFLEIVLAFGNYMNGGTSKGGTYGFTIDSLNRLVETKSTDGKFNLLDYIVKYAYTELKKDNLIENVLNILRQFDDLEYEGVTQSVDKFNKRFQYVKNLKKVLEENKDQILKEDKSDTFLKDFYPDAEKKLAELTTSVNQIKEEYEKLAEYYAINTKKIPLEKFVGVLRKLKDELNISNVKFKEQLEKLKKAQKKK